MQFILWTNPVERLAVEVAIREGRVRVNGRAPASTAWHLHLQAGEGLAGLERRKPDGTEPGGKATA